MMTRSVTLLMGIFVLSITFSDESTGAGLRRVVRCGNYAS